MKRKIRLKKNIKINNIENKILMQLIDVNNLLCKVINTKQNIIRNFTSGISKGIGVGIGFYIITAIIVYIVQKIIKLNIPGISQYIADIVEIVERHTNI
jgi:hypothetical protein